MDEIVRVENVVKTFLNKRVLNSISFSIQKGEAVCILGKSGAGKTVLLKIIVGLLRPDKGNVFLFGRNIFKIKREELFRLRENIGFVFQNSALFDSLTVFENVAYPFLKREISDEEVKEKVLEMLRLVEMQGTENLMPAELSGGMKKRVAIARALIMEPKLVIYDEPTAGLDPATGRSLVEIIKRLNEEKKTTSIIVTHDLEVASTLADRVLFLREGKIVKEVKPEDLKEGLDVEIIKFFNLREV
uniref:ATP-binding cassette domain-containing protein n=1 Tax=candidate division WOR-3 bacterium TaxID=2052148 RepID=A0A7V3ZZ64_UNCW3